MEHSRRAGRTWRWILLAALLGSAGAAQGQAWIPLGKSDNVALDQPRVAVEIYSPPPGAKSFGPEFANTFLLDTGASGLVAVGYAVGELEGAGYRTVAIYDEMGVAGTAPFDVSELYNFDFAGSSGLRHTLSDVRILSNDTANFGGFGGIVGMPAMVHRVTSLDLTPMGDFDDWSFLMGVNFSNSPPADAPHRLSVELELVHFPHSGQRHPDDPLPTFAPLPFLNVELSHGSAAPVTSRFLLDTGAQVSMLSTAVAVAAGVNVDEPLGYVEIGGVGGSVIAPLVALDSMSIPTDQNVRLDWSDLQVIMWDIDESIDGILGMDLLTSGWLDALFDLRDGGYIDGLHFDFRDADNLRGTMLVDLNPDSVDLWLPGDANRDGVVGLADLTILATNYGQAGHDWASGDFTGDGIVGLGDLTILATNYDIDLSYLLEPAASSAAVPEPATVWIAIAAGLLVRRRKTRTC